MYAFLSSRASDEIISSLRERKIEPILLPPFKCLSAPVSTHADMLIFSAGDTIFLPKDYNFSGREIIGKKFNIINISESFSEKYPDDVFLNIALVGDDVFANTKHASMAVLGHLEKIGKRIHHVSQGYAHCSACVVSENAIITADKGIARSAERAELDVLLIAEGSISLPPYNSGFIGGASGYDGENVYFCGRLESHPDGHRIRDFCLSHGKTPIELSEAGLCDVGGIFFV